MAKVLTFSRTFPKGHPRFGQPTYFVEQVLTALLDLKIYTSFHSILRLNQEALDNPKSKLTIDHIHEFWNGLKKDTSIGQKLHTIRAGHRWKQGDIASPRVWSGTPYDSPQIVFAPEVELPEVYDFQIKHKDQFILSDDQKACIFGENSDRIYTIAKNDGLNTKDFLAWFKYPKPFEGQVLCWKGVGYV